MPCLPLSSHFLLTYIVYARLPAKPRACGQMRHHLWQPSGETHGRLRKQLWVQMCDGQGAEVPSRRKGTYV